MARPFSLQPLLEIMQNRADEATQQLGKLIAAEQNQRSRLQMLEQYRQEYAQRLIDSTTQGLPPLLLRNYQDFLARIDEAINQQQLAVQNSEKDTLAGQSHWQAQNKQLKAIDTLSARHQHAELHREEKAAQKIQDEFCTRKFSTPKKPT